MTNTWECQHERSFNGKLNKISTKKVVSEGKLHQQIEVLVNF